MSVCSGLFVAVVRKNEKPTLKWYLDFYTESHAKAEIVLIEAVTSYTAAATVCASTIEANIVASGVCIVTETSYAATIDAQ